MPLLNTKSDAVEYSALESLSHGSRERKRSKNVAPSRSKNVGRVRRSGAKDTRILQRISAFRPADDGVSSSVAHPTPLHTPPHTPSKPIPQWTETSDRVKVIFATGALLIEDTPSVTFSFDLTPEAIAAAHGHPDGFLDPLKRSFDEHLKRVFGAVIPYWFAIDIDDEKRLHIHGACLPPATSIRTIRKLRKAMKGAWGEWEGSGKRKQLWIGKLKDDGWATYSMENQRKVAKLIKGRTFTINQPLRREASWVYGEVRRIMGEVARSGS